MKIARLFALLTITIGCGPLPEGIDGEAPVGQLQQGLAVGNGTINSLCVGTSSDSNSGSNNPLFVAYLTSSNDYWSCQFSSGIPTGTESCCTPSQSFKNNPDPLNAEHLYVGYSGTANTDGLRVGSVSVVVGTTKHITERFVDLSDNIRTVGCSTFEGIFSCSAFWVDGDGNGNCTTADLTWESARIQCKTN